MLKSLLITDHRGGLLQLELIHPENNGIYVSNIEGLGYPQTNITSSKIAQYDIALYNSQEVNERNIVLTLGMIGAPSVEGSRHLLYDYLPIRTPIILEILTDERCAYVNCYVETIEPGIFEELEAVQVSLICLDPYFHAGDAKKEYVKQGGVKNMFRINQWFENTKEEGNYIGSIKKPISILTDDIYNNINIISRFQNPLGFAIIIHGKESGFDRIELNYDEGSMIINDRILDAFKPGVSLNDNLFHQYDDLIITNTPSKVMVEKRDQEGNTTNISDLITVIDDFPMLKAGQNSFFIKTDGVQEVVSTRILTSITDAYPDQYPNSYNQFEFHENTFYQASNINIPGKAYQINIDFVDKSSNWIVEPFDESYMSVDISKLTNLNNIAHPNLYYYFDKQRPDGSGSYTNTQYSFAWSFTDDLHNVPGTDGAWTYVVNEGNLFEYDPNFSWKDHRYIVFYLVEIYYVDGIRRRLFYKPRITFSKKYKSVRDWMIYHMHAGAANNMFISVRSILLKYDNNTMLVGYDYKNANSNVDVIIEHDDIYEAL